MNFEQRMYARLYFRELLAELHESAFEDFFHKIMCARNPGFLDVRTHGNLGDQGADGLTLHSRKLYACYAPQTFVTAAVKAKFLKDLAKAKAKRRGQFDTFVFVHNDRRGMHPQIATLLSDAASADESICFEQMGPTHLWHECMRLDQTMTEEVLGCEIPIKQLTFGVGMEDLAPLLQHLKELRVEADPLMELPDVPHEKLDFNRLQGVAREGLLRGMRNSHLVDTFYDGSVRELEHDEVAQGFRVYYEQVRREWEDPEDVLWQLEMYVLGNGSQRPGTQRAAWVVLSHFFERCDIFDVPAHDWSPAATFGMPA
ncbi:ABC-three component system protein [Kribbella qitaiheensis]|uniref:ABC-three component system protein n=1 Tax=Kribbella qitaiheensis TaxID=1544730 RepID=UPI0036097F0D